jgi:hypothetical protein
MPSPGRWGHPQCPHKDGALPGSAAPPPPGLSMPSPGRRGEPPQAPSQGWIFLPEHPGRPSHRHPVNSHSVGNRLDPTWLSSTPEHMDSAAPSKIKISLSARSGRLRHTRHPFHSVMRSGLFELFLDPCTGRRLSSANSVQLITGSSRYSPGSASCELPFKFSAPRLGFPRSLFFRRLQSCL